MFAGDQHISNLRECRKYLLKGSVGVLTKSKSNPLIQLESASSALETEVKKLMIAVEDAKRQEETAFKKHMQMK